MSEIARAVRSQRQHWAAPGSRHDRLVGTARIVLPVGIGVMVAFLVLAPLLNVGEASFVLDKNKVEVAKERLKIQAAQYRGEDQKGQPFDLTAKSAIQHSSAEPIVQLSDLSARVRLSDGPANIHADSGVYDMDSEKVKLIGPLNFTGPKGYDLKTRDATVDLKTRQMQSGGAVTGTTSQGVFSADSLHADMENRIVTLDGNARLRISPRGTR
ncbi:LPS export ABC transporter periplasmic protein LptC [Sphingomonas bacterium]|uniref:LPS export ABC transporter periplasmic protein LptC n=1 Tax=Sphingomonas bacterium TaxID=1895847 RepID=UPI00157607C5|nr:LPS export ABC transporter periplasmic protein LptC [Sphingomonas bacterium]